VFTAPDLEKYSFISEAHFYGRSNFGTSNGNERLHSEIDKKIESSLVPSYCIRVER